MRSWLWVPTVIVFGVMACDHGPATADNVRQALDQANIHAVEVDVDDEANIVHLQGTVSTMADRTRAHEIATAVVGTSGRVLNELTVVGLTDRRSDDVDGRITDALDQMLDADPVLRERDVNVEVTNGMVAITGEVRTPDEKIMVERMVTAAPGVRGVANGLQIRDEP